MCRNGMCRIVLLLVLAAVMPATWGCTIAVENTTHAPPAYPAQPIVFPGEIQPPLAETGSDPSWLYACEPPTCYEWWTTGGLGVHKSGRVVGTRGVPLQRSGQTIRNGKIVPIR